MLNQAIDLFNKLHYVKATPLLQEAIRLGNLLARAYMAWIILHNTENVLSQSDSRYVHAVQLVQFGANLGCRHCQGVLAYCHTVGKGMEGGNMNYALAYDLARKSERCGSVFGIFALGYLIKYGLPEEGISFAQGAERLVVLLQEAANQGFPDAFKQLVIAYESGYVPRDYVAVCNLLEYLVHKGDGWSCSRLAWYYRKGIGVKKDRVRAKELGDKAFSAGY